MKISNVSFGYNSILKSEWKKGRLPSVTHGLYGGKLTKSNCSLEHIKDKNSGGVSCLKNYALATKENNWLRGCKDIHQFLTIDMIKQYLAQFIDVKTRKFDGNKYIEMVTETFKKLGFEF